MKPYLSALLVSIALAVPSLVAAQTLKDGLDKGLSGIKKGAEKVGQGAAGIAGKVGDTVDSAVDTMTNEPTPEETRAKLDAMAAETLARLFREQPEAQELFEESQGHAVFDTRKVTLLGFTGGAGRGVAISQDNARTYMNMGTAGVGLAFGIGGFETQVVMFFEKNSGFENFVVNGVVNGYDATAEAGTMFGEDSEQAQMRFANGRAVFVLTTKGWRVAATAAGTKYWADASLN
ncbi:MAG: hypothetical protein AAF678_04860 [Pseudomonadota bacterium]